MEEALFKPSTLNRQDKHLGREQLALTGPTNPIIKKNDIEIGVDMNMDMPPTLPEPRLCQVGITKILSVSGRHNQNTFCVR